MATITYGDETYSDHGEVTGLQGSGVCDEAWQMACEIAAERDEPVTLDDDDGLWLVYPDGHREAKAEAEAALSVTRRQIEALRIEAGSAGDEEQVGICDRALDGDAEARAECARVIAEAAALAAEDE